MSLCRLLLRSLKSGPKPNCRLGTGRKLARQCSSRADHTFTKLDPFGVLRLSGDANTVFNIKPVDPVMHPDQNIAILDVPSQVIPECPDNKSIDVNARNKNTEGKCVCNIEVPLKFQVHGQLQDESSVNISSLECEQIRLSLDAGSCRLEQIKCDQLGVTSSTGLVSCETVIHANGAIATESADIHINKALGDTLDVQCTSEGSVHIGSSYVDKLVATTNNGDVTIDSCHRNAKLSTALRGNVNIGTLDGNLTANVKHGNVTAYVTQHEDVCIAVERGAVNLKLPHSVDTGVHLEAPEIEIEDQFDTSELRFDPDERTVLKGRLRCVQDDTSRDINSSTRLNSDRDISKIIESQSNLKIVITNGRLSVKPADWLSTLNLRGLQEVTLENS